MKIINLLIITLMPSLALSQEVQVLEKPELEIVVSLNEQDAKAIKKELKQLQKQVRSIQNIYVITDLNQDGKPERLGLLQEEVTEGTKKPFNTTTPKQTQGATFGERILRPTNDQSGESIVEVQNKSETGLSSTLGELVLEENEIIYTVITTPPKQSQGTDFGQRRPGRAKFNNIIMKRSMEPSAAGPIVFYQSEQEQELSIVVINQAGEEIAVLKPKGKVRRYYATRTRVEVLKSN